MFFAVLSTIHQNILLYQTTEVYFITVFFRKPMFPRIFISGRDFSKNFITEPLQLWNFFRDHHAEFERRFRYD